MTAADVGQKVQRTQWVVYKHRDAVLRRFKALRLTGDEGRAFCARLFGLGDLLGPRGTCPASQTRLGREDGPGRTGSAGPTGLGSPRMESVPDSPASHSKSSLLSGRSIADWAKVKDKPFPYLRVGKHLATCPSCLSWATAIAYQPTEHYVHALRLRLSWVIAILGQSVSAHGRTTRT